MNTPKKRLIFSNYDIEEDYWESAIEDLKIDDPDYEPTETEILDKCYQLSQNDWEIEKDRLEEFFNEGDTQWILIGSVQRWNGTFSGGLVFNEFREMFNTVSQDCDYWKFWDENGHLYVKSSHHDGNNLFEIKKLTLDGQRFYYNWNYSDDKRYAISDKECHKKLIERYSVLPNFCHKVYGVPKIENVKAS